MNTRELREIPGFPNYFVGDDGTVWTKKSKGGNDRIAGCTGPLRQLKWHQNRSGYAIVSLDLNGRVVTRAIHRLVLETFVGPPPAGYEACHYPDKTPTNNRLENLRWDSHSENTRDRFRDRIRGHRKACRRCGKKKPRDQFYNDKRASDGLKSECKRCHISVSIATRDPEKKRAANRDYMRRKRQEMPGYGR